MDSKTKVYLMIRPNFKLNKIDLICLNKLSKEAKKLYNRALYNVRQHYINQQTYITYNKIDDELIDGLKNHNNTKLIFKTSIPTQGRSIKEITIKSIN